MTELEKETITASVFPSVRVPYLRVSSLFSLVRPGGVRAFDSP